ncbi:hypothetical protein SeLEV6574_g06300 [Synchytrium endobioticum]|uniref:Integrase zinc-binding domain-containing protein n=1 Tax=Synchytrium endobioticum TaxID=286115 RepID=A0A507CPD0_9FUNG|nr:hypothetical protein SeLEV6574_g06300 [Synchytrium endobioticum]
MYGPLWDLSTPTWIPGKENMVADASSRNPNFGLSEDEMKERSMHQMLSTNTFTENEEYQPNQLITTVTTSNARESQSPQKLQVQAASQDKTLGVNHRENDQNSTTREKQPHQKDITHNTNLPKEILTLYHDHPLAGHYGYRKTLELILRRYWWKGINA